MIINNFTGHTSLPQSHITSMITNNFNDHTSPAWSQLLWSRITSMITHHQHDHRQLQWSHITPWSYITCMITNNFSDHTSLPWSDITSMITHHLHDHKQLQWSHITSMTNMQTKQFIEKCMCAMSWWKGMLFLKEATSLWLTSSVKFCSRCYDITDMVDWVSKIYLLPSFRSRWWHLTNPCSVTHHNNKSPWSYPPQ